MFLNILSVMSSSIFIMLLGFFMGRTNRLKSSFSTQLSEIILCVSIPALSFNAFMLDFDKKIFINGINILILSFLIHFFFMAFGGFFYKKYNSSEQTTLKMMSIFGGVTVFGIPIVQALYGNIGIIYTSIFCIPYRILLYSYGFIKMSEIKISKKNIHTMFLNSVIISTFLGLTIWIFQKYLPTININGTNFPILRIDKTAIWLYQPLTFLAKLCSPLAWLAAGLKLSEISIKKSLKDVTVWYFSIVKTLVVPILTCTLVEIINYFGYLNISKVGLGVIIIMMGTPTASVIIAYSFKFNKDPAITSRCSFLSTVFSLFTIPLLILVMQYLK